MIAAILILPLLATCTDGAGQRMRAASVPDLETAAIAAGLISDPRSADLSGVYARDTDRVCVVPDRLGYRIGAFVDYGDRLTCGGTGTVAQAGDAISIRFPSAPGCTFDARYEGDRIVFPGKLPRACQSLCSGRASLAALDVARLSDSVAEAATLRDARGRPLCATETASR